MKTISSLVTAQDIRELLAKADESLPVVKLIQGGISLRLKKEGAVTFVYLYNNSTHKYIGVVAVQRDALGTKPKVRGVRVFSAGLLARYQKLGNIWHVLDAIGETNRVFSSPSTSERGKKMWLNRLETDHRHAYLIYRPKPFHTNYGDLNWFPLSQYQAKKLESVIWDGSYLTRLVMTSPKDPLLNRLHFGKAVFRDIALIR